MNSLTGRAPHRDLAFRAENFQSDRGLGLYIPDGQSYMGAFHIFIIYRTGSDPL